MSEASHISQWRSVDTLLQVITKAIAANDCNIAVSIHVVQKDTREAIDSTTLSLEIAGIVARQSELRRAIDEIVADLEGTK